jgi:hypothetical protein
MSTSEIVVSTSIGRRPFDDLEQEPGPSRWLGPGPCTDDGSDRDDLDAEPLGQPEHHPLGLALRPLVRDRYEPAVRRVLASDRARAPRRSSEDDDV